jgi:hypothetical protein
MTGNIVGEEFKKYVFDQIAQRQKDQYSGYDSNRTPEQLQYLNNKTAWVKLASGMEFVEEEISGFDGYERLQEILGKEGIVEQLRGKNLAEKTILFNGTSFLNRAEINESYDDEGNPVYGEDNFQRTGKGLGYQFRSGYSKSKSIWNFGSAYGLGGTDFGQQPMPGITSMTTKSLNRGSIKEANIQIKCYNKFQFAILELLYLRLGFTMMLEWGNDKYISSVGEYKDKLIDVGNTIIEDVWFTQDCFDQLSMLEKIEEYRVKYEGNYDGFFGKVVNFTWTFNADGSYDIDLKLVTVGDVVESFQANLPVDSYDLKKLKDDIEDEEIEIPENLEDSPLVKSAQNNIIGKHLFDTLYNADNVELWDGVDYFDLGRAVQGDIGYRKPDSSIDGEFDSIRTIQKNTEQFNYFIRLGKLLELVENKVVPGIEHCSNKVSPMLSIEKNIESNIISYYPNQISLDPRVCIFKYVLGDLGDADGFGIGGIQRPYYLEGLSEYVDVKENGVVYGKLMNLYLNYDFVAKCLESSGGGKITLFKFLKEICRGINDSLGGLNHLEPILKKDKIITIIDQNPIPGFIDDINTNNDIVDLEVYGYNKDKKLSNFVKDISFKTQITPDLASMISIGTTAGGSSTREDGTAFSYWNQGLRDRFSPKITDPSEKETGIKTDKEKEKDKKDTRIQEIIDAFNKSDRYLPWPFYRTDGIDSKYYKETEYTNTLRNLKFEGSYYVGISIRGLIEEVLKRDEYLAQNANILSPEQLAANKQESFARYLIEAFGGSSDIIVSKQRYIKNLFSKGASSETKEEKIKPIPRANSIYHHFNSEFIGKGKSLYKGYINTIKNNAYRAQSDQKLRSPSNTIGFIPVGFNITLEGIAGIKIYNKLNINNTFLPQNYPNALKFLIQKVDHKIQDNTWETDLDTLSIPNTLPNKFDKEKFLELAKSGESLLPVIERGPKPLPPGKSSATYIIYQGKKYSGNYFKITSEFMNPDAQDTFNRFFSDFVNNWDGYTMNINAIGRSIEKSKELKQENNQNADPGRSKHNYYAAIDCNITDNRGRTLMKNERLAWVNHGFEALAEKYGMEWGGNFNTYIDSIHFGYKFKISDAVANAIVKYGSLENMKGDDGKSVKLT